MALNENLLSQTVIISGEIKVRSFILKQSEWKNIIKAQQKMILFDGIKILRINKMRVLNSFPFHP